MRSPRRLPKRPSPRYACAEPLERRTLLSAALVADVNQVPVGSQPTLLTPVGSRLFFAANDGVHGTELWTSDGTDAGTLMVKDVRPGPDGSAPTSITDVGGIAWFVADDGAHGKELWRSDGTAAGTYLVADIAPGSAASSPINLTPFAGRLYFVASNGTNGSELWSVDTRPGAAPAMVKDIYAGATSSNPSGLLVAGGRLYFAAYDATGGNELWSTAGTATTTARVTDLVPGSTGSYPMPMAAIGSKVLFRATTSAAGTELWVTDGTAGGTTMVKDINPGPNGSFGSGGSPVRWTTLDGQLLWTADDGAHGLELWRSDGTADGTYLLSDIRTGSASPNIYSLAVCQGLAYFNATDSTFATGLWASDGTVAGTRLVAGAAQLNHQTPSTFCPVGGLMYFLTQSGLWVSDGTADGTSFVHMFGGGNASFMTAAGGTLYVSAGNPDGSRVELWASDGTDAGTRRVGAGVSAITRSSSPISLTPADGVLYFSADDGVHGREVWRTDGTAAGTWMLKDINPSASTWAPQDLTWVGGMLYFKAAEDDVPTFGLWMSDGTEAGTAPVPPPSTGSFGDDMVGYKGALFIEGSSQSSKVLWRVDSTGTVTLAAGLAVAASASVYDMRVSGGLLYFVVSGQLWRSDGTSGGTYAVGTGGNAQFLTDVNGTLYFTASDPTHGTELWRSNGTAAGTYMVRDITAGAASTSMYYFANVSGTLFFAANYALWKSNGSSGSTVQVSTAAQYVANIVGLNGVAYFTASPGGGGDQLWRSDGTSAGTFAVSPQTGGSIYDVTSVNGYVYADLNGSEVWRADGTSAAAVRIFQSPETAGNTHPGTFRYANGLLFFEVDDPAKGNELYAFYPPVADPGGTYRTPTGRDLSLDASASYDPGGASLAYAWDLDGDGVFGETGAAAACGNETGATPVYHAPATDGIRVVKLRVTDQMTGLFSTAYVMIDVAAPPAGSLPAVTAAEGQAVNVGFENPTGRGPLRYSFDFDNDGTWDAVDSATASVVHTYPDNGTYVIRGRITDRDGSYTDVLSAATVTNLAPTATLANITGVEGVPIPIGLTGAADDSIADMIAGLVYSFDLDNDGTFETAAPFAHADVVFPDNGTYTVRARIVDKDGGTSVYAATVVVADADPTSSMTGPTTVVEGSGGATIAFGTVTDVPADAAAGFTYSYDFDDDGTFEIVASPLSSATVPAEFLADGPSVRVVRGRVMDKDGGYSEYATAIDVTNAPPSAAFTNVAATAGVPVVLTLTDPTDVSSRDAAGLMYSFDLDNDGTFEVPESASPFTTVRFDTLGPHLVRARVWDKDGGSTVYTATVTVSLPPAPSAAFSGGGPVDEGTAGSVLFGPASGAGSFTYSYDFDNDGTFEVAGTTSAAATVPAEYLADGPFVRVVRGRVTDAFGQFADYTATIAVTNVEPTLAIPAAAGGSVVLGTGFALSLSAVDPGRDAVTHWHINWGDGQTSDSALPSGLFNHTYESAGIFPVTATATDEDGSYAATTNVTVTATPPTASFSAGSLTAGGSAYRFTVNYADDLGIDAATLGDGDLEITGPAGTSLARLVSYAPASDGRGGVATYDVASPLGTWSWQDRGTYAVSVRAGEVRDLQGIDLPAGEIGSFAINLSAPSAPDLVQQFVGPTPKSLAPGGTYSVSVKVTNHGSKSMPTAPVTTRLYLSADGTVDVSDVLLATSKQRFGLPINGSRQITFSFASPVITTGGGFKLLAVVDAAGKVAERDERNNAATSGRVSVKPAKVDLATSFASAPKSGYAPGKPVPLSLKFTNAGNAPAKGRAGLRVYFSTNPVLDDSDTLLLTRNVRLNLATKASSVFNVKVKLPASAAGPKGYLLAILDASGIGDRKHANDSARTGPFALPAK